MGTESIKKVDFRDAGGTDVTKTKVIDTYVATQKKDLS